MALAGKLKAFLREHQAELTTLPHPKTYTSHDAAARTRAPEDRIAEGDRGSFDPVSIPGHRRLCLGAAGEALGRQVRLARDADGMLDHCDPGAVPPRVGPCGLQTLGDEAPATMADLCIDGGGHRTLAHVTADRFRRLTPGARTGHFAQPG